MTAKGVEAWAPTRRCAPRRPWVNMLGDSLDAKSINEAAQILDALRRRLERPSPDDADEA